MWPNRGFRCRLCLNLSQVNFRFRNSAKFRTNKTLIVRKETQKKPIKKKYIYIYIRENHDSWEPSLKIDNSKFCENCWPWKSPNWFYFFNSEKPRWFSEWEFFKKIIKAICRTCPTKTGTDNSHPKKEKEVTTAQHWFFFCVRLSQFRAHAVVITFTHTVLWS